MEGEFLIQTSRGSITNEPGTTSRRRKRGCVHRKALFAGHSGVFCQLKRSEAKQTEGLSPATALQAYKYEYISHAGLPVACIGKIYYLFKGPYFHSSLLAGMLIRSCITLAEETPVTAKARPPALRAVYCSRRRGWVTAMTSLHI